MSTAAAKDKPGWLAYAEQGFFADLITLAFDMIAEVLHPSSEHERLTLFLIKIQNVSDQGFFGVKASHVLTRYGT